MAKRIKTLGANVPVPQSRDEAAAMLRRLGEASRQVGRIEADCNDAVARIKESAEAGAAPLKAEIEAMQTGLKTWAEANRTALTGGDKTKTVDLGTGLLKWRLRPQSVTLRKVEDIIVRIRALGFARRFLRTKVEIDKEAMLRDPARARQVAGVTIGTEGEDFICEPFEVELAGGAQ